MRIATLVGLLMVVAAGRSAAGAATPEVVKTGGPPRSVGVQARSRASHDWTRPGALTTQAPAPWAPDDPADSLYQAARSALANGDYRRAAELFHRISDTYPKSAYASAALYYEAFALYRSGETADLRSALNALQRLGTADAPASRRGDAATLRTRVCTALARQGDASCTVRIEAQAESASRQCPTEDDENDVRIAALNGLMQMDAERAMPILQKVLDRRDACSVALRRKALFLVSQREPPASTDLLMASARQDPDAEVREQAVFWLSQVHDARVVAMLDSIATHEGQENVREKAVFALSQQDNAQSVAALRTLAAREDLEPDLREKVVFWLGQSHVAESATFLEDLFTRTTNEALKEKILFALSQHGGATDWIVNVAGDARQPDDVRKKAIFWASQGGVGIDRLVTLYGHITEPEVREEILFAISQRHDPSAVDALMTVAKSDKDPELRKKAVFWLGQSSDPRAGRFLQELINQ